MTLTFRRYAAVIDVGTAKKFGYHVPEDPGFDEVIAQQESWGSDVSVVDDCGRRAQAEILRGLDLKHIGPQNSWVASPVRELNLQRVTSRDPKVVAAQAEWSKCMAEGGYHMATTLSDLPQGAAPLGSDTKPSRSEIEMALHDVACQRRSGVISVLYETELAYQEEQIRANQEVFSEILKENQKVLEKAVRLAR
uniref:hypothetical protein n=1 Tax=Nocardioides sp. NPDC006273 TaxID=3155598 RepID=UPI0033B68F8F